MFLGAAAGDKKMNYGLKGGNLGQITNVGRSGSYLNSRQLQNNIAQGKMGDSFGPQNHMNIN